MSSFEISEPMKSEHTFRTEDDAAWVSKELNHWGSRRNYGSTIAFRDGRRVYLRSDFTSRDSMRELSRLVEGIES